ncbi:20091_t:CDS:2 [Gigaspora margarita]|uniref:20091_t:CDS:1 n=1 Tax=Gigaspora margarita TaxID=4874 RepID=A0ABN7UPJ6_GIGMA|nr:20091_t:CDS:2 [Gigaspora margarita]
MPKTKPEAMKIPVQLLKELGYSDSAMMSITRHKSQKGLTAYERSKSVMQHEEAPGNHDDGKAPYDHEAPSGHENPKESSNILAERNQNILEKDSQKDEVKGVKTDGQKKE